MLFSVMPRAHTPDHFAICPKHTASVTLPSFDLTLQPGQDIDPLRVANSQFIDPATNRNEHARFNMSTPKSVAVLVGSLRRASISAGIAEALGQLAPASLRLHRISIDALPFYNPDLEEDAPEPWTTLRELVRKADAILFVTPEYNRSVPAVLKNAVDVGSRPKEQNAWNGKPAAVISLSQGTLGGFGAAHHLRQSLVCLNVLTMPTPEVYLSFANKMLDASGQISSTDTRGFLSDVLASFSAWIDRCSATRA